MAIWMRNWKHVRDLTHSIAVLAFAALGTSLIASSTSYAQNFPSKVIKFVLPLSAGSPIDVIARIVAPALSSRLKQSVISRIGPAVARLLAREPSRRRSQMATLCFSRARPTHLVRR